MGQTKLFNRLLYFKPFNGMQKNEFFFFFFFFFLVLDSKTWNLIFRIRHKTTIDWVAHPVVIIIKERVPVRVPCVDQIELFNLSTMSYCWY